MRDTASVVGDGCAGNGEAVLQDMKSEAACRFETELHGTMSEVGDDCPGNGEAVLQDVRSESGCRLETELQDTASGIGDGYTGNGTSFGGKWSLLRTTVRAECAVVS